MNTYTIRTLLSWCRDWLTGRGIADTPRLDCELLLARALNCRRLDLFLDPDRPLRPEELAAVKPLLQRRAAREPVAYILGEREFWSLPFRVGPGVLTPRPESEGVVEAVLARLPPGEGPLRLLDVGTGSGCLLLSLLSERKTAVGIGLDRSPEALEHARENARRLGLEGRARFVRGEGCAALVAAPRFHGVVANPPYIATRELSALPPEVGRWEPREALDGGEDGLRCLAAWIPAMTERLLPGGVLAVECGWDQGEAVTSLLERAGLRERALQKDYAGLPRVGVGLKP